MTDKEYQHKYYLAHKEEILKKHKEYYEYSKDFQQKSREEYRKAHKEEQKAYSQKHYLKNKESRKEYMREYRKQNREKINAYFRKRYAEQKRKAYQEEWENKNGYKMGSLDGWQDWKGWE